MRFLLVCVALLMAAPISAQAPAPVPTMQQIYAAQEKVVAGLLAKLRATKEFQEYEAARQIAEAMKARIDAEKPKQANASK